MLYRIKITWLIKTITLLILKLFCFDFFIFQAPNLTILHSLSRTISLWISLLIIIQINSIMKALLGMAKQRRKQQPKQFNPVSKLNLNKNQQQQQQLQHQYHEQQEQFQQQDDQDQQQYFQPDQDQILGYAQYIGIKIPGEEDLLYIAEQGLMANLPPEWTEQDTEDGNVIYVNRRTGQMLAEHPCDEYYRQLVIKQRKKRGKDKESKAGKFVGIQPVGANMGLANNAMAIQQQPQPRKDMDPLVKLQLQKKKKKLQQQKRKQFQQKKKQISQKYQKKKQTLQSEYRTKQKKLKSKYDEEIESERKNLMKRMSQQEKDQQQKLKKEIEKFEREIRAKLQRKYYDKRKIQQDKLQKEMKLKREQIRISLQNTTKSKKKQFEDEYRQKLKLLSQKQKQSLTNAKSDTDIFAQEINQLKQQIIAKRIKQHNDILKQQRDKQQSQYKIKLHEIQKNHEELVKNIQTSAPKTSYKFDVLAQEVEQLEKQELEVLEYEIEKIRELKKMEKQYALEKYKNDYIEEHKEDLARLERQTQNILEKLQKIKQQELANKLIESQKRIKQQYLNSLQDLKRKFDQQQQIIQLQKLKINRNTSPQPNNPNSSNNNNNGTLQNNSIEVINQMLINLSRKQQTIREQINALRAQIDGLSKNYKPIKHKLNDQQLKMYELIKNRLESQQV